MYKMETGTVGSPSQISSNLKTQYHLSKKRTNNLLDHVYVYSAIDIKPATSNPTETIPYVTWIHYTHTCITDTITEVVRTFNFCASHVCCVSSVNAKTVCSCYHGYVHAFDHGISINQSGITRTNVVVQLKIGKSLGKLHSQKKIRFLYRIFHKEKAESRLDVVVYYGTATFGYSLWIWTELGCYYDDDDDQWDW